MQEVQVLFCLCHIHRHLEVHADVGKEAASVGRVEVVVAHVGQSKVVAHLGIEVVELQTAA